MRIIKFDTKTFTVTEAHYIQGVSDVWSSEQALGYRQKMAGFRRARALVPKVKIYKLLTSVSSIFIWKFIHQTNNFQVPAMCMVEEYIKAVTKASCTWLWLLAFLHSSCVKLVCPRFMLHHFLSCSISPGGLTFMDCFTWDPIIIGFGQWEMLARDWRARGERDQHINSSHSLPAFSWF